MSKQKQAEVLYSTKSDLYHHFFMDILHYNQGVEMFIKEHIHLEKGMRVLDAGTGSGILIKALYNTLPRNLFKQITFTAFDITPTMLKLFAQWIEKNKLENINIFQADVLTIDKQLKDNTYDVILSSGMLEYLSKDDFSKALYLLFKILKKNGKLVLFISKKNLLSFLIITLWWKANIFSIKELTSTFKKVSFTKITSNTFPKQFNYLNWCMSIIEGYK